VERSGLILGLRMLVLGWKLLELIRQVLKLVIFAGRGWRKLELVVLFFENDGVHSINRAVAGSSRKKLFAFDSTGHNIADQRVFLGQVCCEVHFLPFVLLANSESWKSEVGPNSGAFNEVEEAVWKER